MFGLLFVSHRYGDYPMLPYKSQYERDPWYQWDQPEMRHNWGEPMHWDFDMYTRNRADTSPTVVPWHTMRKHFFLFLGTMLIMFGLGAIYPSYMPVGPKQYPFNDLYLEKGGDPNKKPPPVIHYEI